MRRFTLAAVLFLACAMVIAAVPRAATDDTPLQRPFPDARLARVEQWLKAVMAHEPGTTDDSAGLVGSWSNDELRTLWLDSNVIIQLMRNPKGSGFNVRPGGRRPTQQFRYTTLQLHRLRVLACAAAGIVAEPVCLEIKASTELDADLRRLSSLAGAAKRRGDDNYILRRGALLHADIAMLLPAATEPIGATTASGPQRIRLRISDGLGIDLGQVAAHWELARMVLDYVKPRGADRPDPGRDDMVRQWYRATAAWMQSTESHDTVHLNRARAIFPTDPDILFLSGCQRETYAAPPIQSALRSAVLPSGVQFDVGSDQDELRQAETFFGRALTANADMPEAHLRLGRVLSLRGRHAAATNELRQALASTEDPLLEYYGEMFLGAAEEALGRFDAAWDAYAEAAVLFPTAQSPRIALSALARRRGDRGAALRELQRVFDLPATEPERHDPLWTYRVAQARNANDLLEQLRRPFLGEAEP